MAESTFVALKKRPALTSAIESTFDCNNIELAKIDPVKIVTVTLLNRTVILLGNYKKLNLHLLNLRQGRGVTLRVQVLAEPPVRRLLRRKRIM